MTQSKKVQESSKIESPEKKEETPKAKTLSETIKLYESIPSQYRCVHYLAVEDIAVLNKLLKGSAKIFDDLSIRVNKITIVRGDWVLFNLAGDFIKVVSNENFKSNYKNIPE
jgi:hypothetical protein